MQRCIIATDGEDSVLRKAIGSDWKGKLSPVLYMVAIGSSFIVHWVAQAIYVGVALIWLIPDKRIEKAINRT